MSESNIDEKRLSQITLSADDLARYSRHLLLPELKAEGQRALKPRACSASARAAGISTASISRCGVERSAGRFDRVDIPICNGDPFGTKTLAGQIGSSRERSTTPILMSRSSRTKSFHERERRTGRPYFIIDGSDNFPTRYLSMMFACCTQAECLRFGLPFDGQPACSLRTSRTMLPLPFS